MLGNDSIGFSFPLFRNEVADSGDDRSIDCGEDSTSILVVQDNAEEATMDRQSALVVIYKTKSAELVHEMTNS